MSLVIIAGLILHWEGYGRRSLLLPVLLLAGLVAGGSTGPWLLLGIYWLLLVPYRRMRRPPYAVAEVSVAFFVATFVCLFVGWISTANWFADVFWDPHRVAKWRLAGALFAEHPFVGIGPGQFQVIDQLQINQARDYGSNPHNVYLQIAVESGILGIVGFLLPTLVIGARRIGENLAAASRSPSLLVLLFGFAASYIGFLPSASTTLSFLLILTASTLDLHRPFSRTSQPLAPPEAGHALPA